MDQLRSLTKLVDLARNNHMDKAMGPQRALIFVKVGEEERMVGRQSGDALYRDPEIVARNVAIPTGPAVASKRLGVSIALANEQPGLEGGLVVDLVEASGKEPLPLACLGMDTAHDKSRSEEMRPESSVSWRSPSRS